MKNNFISNNVIKEIIDADLDEQVEEMLADKPLSSIYTRNLLNFALNYIWQFDFRSYVGYLILPQINSRIWALSYAWIIYLDGLIDSEVKSSEKRMQLDKAISFLNSGKNIHKIKLDNIFDKLASVYVAIEEKSNLKTIDDMQGVFHSYEIDLERKGKVLSWDEYENLIYYKGICLLDLSCRLFYGQNNSNTSSLSYHFGQLTILADDIIDIYKDLSFGYINITKEELDEFKIKDPFNLTTGQFQIFCEWRHTLIANHALSMLELINSDHFILSNNVPRKNAELVLKALHHKKIFPDIDFSLPLEPLLRKITNINDKIKFENAFRILIRFIISIPWVSTSKVYPQYYPKNKKLEQVLSDSTNIKKGRLCNT